MRISFFLMCFFFSSQFYGEGMWKWFIAIKKNQGNDLLASPTDYVSLLAPKGRYFADPMLIKYKGINYVFFENFDFKRGILGCVSVDENLKLSKPMDVSIGEEVHLSFPYMFIENDKVYMVPESNNNWQVALYEAVTFPTKWQKVRTLISGQRYSDSILFKHNDYYWLITSEWMDYMSIFYAKDLFSEFLPHPINADKLHGRNAGGVFHYDGKLIRPIMDCSRMYGESIIFKEIISLTPTEFVEKEVGQIKPNWASNLLGTHTFSINEDLIVYDGVRHINVLDDEHFSSNSETYGN